MASRREVGAYRAAQNDAVALAQADLAAFWRTLDHSDARAAADAVQGFLPALVGDYGSVGAAVAADFYDDLRDRAELRRPYRAHVAEPAPEGQARAVARWGVGPLFAANPDTAGALGILADAVQRLVLQPGRATIADNAAHDPADVRWARNPTGPNVCAWCRMLASRGAVYASKATAGGMTDWHTACWCVPEPVFADEPLSYDADALLQQYNNARAQAGGNPKAITAQMRQDLGVS